MIKNRLFALIFRTASFILCLLGIFATVGVLDGQWSFKSLLYYTIQSNIMVLVLFGVLLVRTATDYIREGTNGNTSYYPRITVAVTMAITVTFLVYWILLAPTAKGGGGLWNFKNLSVHAFTPLLCIADYILFTETGHMKKKDPWLMALIPVVYFIQATILGFSGVVYAVYDGVKYFFPYFFIDYYQTGGWVALYVIAIAAFFIGFAYLLLWIDGKWKKPQLFRKPEQADPE